MEDSVKRKTEKKIVPKKNYSLADYRKEKGLDKVAFKEQKWLTMPKPFQKATGVPGIPMGGLSLIAGHSDTSKTTLMIEAAKAAQALGALPIFIITEMKFSFSHLKLMGFECEEIKDENGNIIDINGNFLYIDRSKLPHIEAVAEFINKTLDDQEKGLLPYDLVFLWDSIGSLPSQMSVEKQKNNNEWAALSYSVQFASSINGRITASSKSDSLYTNTLIAINRVWVQKAENIMAQPRIEFKGGRSMYLDAKFIVFFGNVKSSGIQKLRAVKGGKELTFGSKVNVQVLKNHVNGIDYKGSIVVTPHGYIDNEKKDIEEYKKNNLDFFSKIMGENLTEDSFKIELSENEDEFDLSSLTNDDE